MERWDEETGLEEILAVTSVVALNTARVLLALLGFPG